MLIPYIALLILVCFGMKFSKGRFFREESFSRPITDSMKGISIWLVFISHSLSYITLNNTLDTMAQSVHNALGQLIVVCFMFYSGYGVCEAIKKRGSEYVRLFPKNRIGKTLLHFSLAVVLYWVIGIAMGSKFPITTILLSFIGWESLGNSNWYIFVILCLYLITWIAFSISKNNIKSAAFIVFCLSLFLMLFLFLTRQKWWYDTLLCYTLGMYVSIYKDNLINFATKSNKSWWLCLIVLVALFSFTYVLPFIPLPGSWLLGAISNPLICCLLITVIPFKVRISNKLLIWSGNYTFEIYILQRMPMILLQACGIAKINTYLFFVLSFVSTIVIAICFRWCTQKIDSILFKERKRI